MLALNREAKPIVQALEGKKVVVRVGRAWTLRTRHS
jgi:hypothetical protein